MKNPLLIVSTLVLMSIGLAGCSSSTTDKLKETGEFLGKRVLNEASKIASRVIIDTATSWADGRDKADFLDSAAQGLRENMLTVVRAEDIAEIVRIWTPARGGPSHWNELAVDLADLYAKNATGPERIQIIEQIAQGLQLAAEAERQP